MSHKGVGRVGAWKPQSPLPVGLSCTTSLNQASCCLPAMPGDCMKHTQWDLVATYYDN